MSLKQHKQVRCNSWTSLFLKLLPWSKNFTQKILNMIKLENFFLWSVRCGELYMCAVTDKHIEIFWVSGAAIIDSIIKAVNRITKLGLWDLYIITDVKLTSPSISRVQICCRGKKRCLKLCICVPLTTILKDWFSQQMVSCKKRNKYLWFTFLIHISKKYIKLFLIHGLRQRMKVLISKSNIRQYQLRC